jgi:phage terminase Nu1 subunit (DNA packaging protein)
MANLDSRGYVIKNKKLVGKKVAYHINDVIQWLEQNTKLVK